MNGLSSSHHFFFQTGKLIGIRELKEPKNSLLVSKKTIKSITAPGWCCVICWPRRHNTQVLICFLYPWKSEESVNKLEDSCCPAVGSEANKPLSDSAPSGLPHVKLLFPRSHPSQGINSWWPKRWESKGLAVLTQGFGSRFKFSISSAWSHVIPLLDSGSGSSTHPFFFKNFTGLALE